MDKQAQWDIETLQKTIGVIPYEEMEQQVYYLLEENGNLERTIKAAYKACEQIEKNRKELQRLMQELSKLYTNRGVKKNE